MCCVLNAPEVLDVAGHSIGLSNAFLVSSQIEFLSPRKPPLPEILR